MQGIRSPRRRRHVLRLVRGLRVYDERWEYSIRVVYDAALFMHRRRDADAAFCDLVATYSAV